MIKWSDIAVFLVLFLILVAGCDGGSSTPDNYKITAFDGTTYSVRDCYFVESAMKCTERSTNKEIDFGGNYIIIAE